MNKKGFTIIEVVVVFLIILGATFLIIPKNLDATRHAKLISKWNQKYNELQYMFSAIIAQNGSEIEEMFNLTHDDKRKQQIVFNAIKPYLRIINKVKEPYQQIYMDKKLVSVDDLYGFADFYYTSSGEIVGFKVINLLCQKREPCIMINFDVNGIKEPNMWGYDVFGINVLKDKIEPLGKNIDINLLKHNCSRHDSGVYCSYYYLIGGRFD